MPRERKSDPEIRAQAQNAADLVEYQSGSVVSRTIVDKDTGSVTVFAFAEGEGLSEHTAPFDALVHVIEGKAEVTISGKPHSVTAGELILMPADEPHALDAPEPFKMVLTMIRK
jgi:quercetin dioxygenase-like cupin family protein